jgi:hypothetical protein
MKALRIDDGNYWSAHFYALTGNIPSWLEYRTRNTEQNLFNCTTLTSRCTLKSFRKKLMSALTMV